MRLFESGRATARLTDTGGGVALVGVVLTGYARRAAFDADQFANRATTALEDDSVRSLAAERITDDVVLSAQADLVAARPAIESAAERIVGSEAFTGLFRAAVRDVHRRSSTATRTRWR